MVDKIFGRSRTPLSVVSIDLHPIVFVDRTMASHNDMAMRFALATDMAMAVRRKTHRVSCWWDLVGCGWMDGGVDGWMD